MTIILISYVSKVQIDQILLPQLHFSYHNHIFHIISYIICIFTHIIHPNCILHCFYPFLLHFMLIFNFL